MLGNENPFANRASAVAWNPVHAAWNTVAHLGAVSGWPGRDETVLIGENHGLHPVAQAELG
jgi:hypothetical protein